MSTYGAGKARKVAKRLGYELVARSITRPLAFRHAFEEMSDDIQAYWILADPVVFSTRNMD